jgi:hypothetical protein
MISSRASLALLGLLWTVPAVAQTRTPTPTPTPAVAPAAAPAATPAPRPIQKLDYDSLAFGRLANEWFLTGEIDSLWAHTDSGMKANMGSKDQWMTMQMQFTSRAGTEASLVEERWVKRNNTRQYWHIFHATEFTDEPVMLRWALFPGKMIAGLGMNPLSQAPPVDQN